VANHALRANKAFLDKIIWPTMIGFFLLFLSLPFVKSFYFGSGLRWQYIFTFSFLAAYFLTPLCRLVAIKFNVLDTPDWRKIHDQPTPLLGGLAIYLAFSVSLLLNGVFLTSMKILLLGATLIFVMGLWDDFRPIPASLKFIFQILGPLSLISLSRYYGSSA
jgi:UDP-N-acetylmuramyl pentapeptide phosphotransferase/UDP-N-acetylglucosamine-1-phosphate transferase